MIKNLWQKVRIFCGNGHDEPIEMVLNNFGKTPFYSCPNYYEKNRAENERACANRINLDDYEGIVMKLSDILSESSVSDNYTNYEYDYRGLRAKIHVKIVKYSTTEIRLEVTNLTALKQ